MTETIRQETNSSFPNYRGRSQALVFNSLISYPLYKLVSLSQLSYFLMYEHCCFATRLFVHGHLNSLLLHVTYILSLFNLHSLFSNVFFLRNSLLTVSMYLGHDSFLKLTIIMSLNQLSILHCSFVLYYEMIYRMSIGISQSTLLKHLDKKTNFFFNYQGSILGPCV